MRLRQICLVADNLEETLDGLSRLLDSPVMFRDPEVGFFGLANGLVMSGGDFIEVVSPLPGSDDTAAGRQLARRGNGFYMAIFQLADANQLIEHISGQGIRTAFDYDKDGVRARHFHPRDFGGAIVSIDSMGREDWQSPTAYWQWTHWPDADAPAPDTNTAIGAIAGLGLTSATPDTLAAHWGGLLQRPQDGDGVSLDRARLRFIAGDTEAPYVSDVYMHAGRDTAPDICARALDMVLKVSDNRVDFGGVRWHFG